MTYYKVYYGTWRDGESVHHLCETFVRREAFERAKKTANELGVKVTILASRGMQSRNYTVYPEG